MGTATALLAAGCGAAGTTSAGAAGNTGATAGTGTGTGTTSSATTTADPPPDAAATGTSFPAPSHAPAAAPAGRPVVYGCDQQPVAKPKTYVLLCGDGGVVLDKLAWSGWGKPKATATGVQLQNNCVPDCAAGSPITTKATVTVSGLSGLSGGHYTKLHVATAKGAADYTIGSTGPLPKG